MNGCQEEKRRREKRKGEKDKFYEKKKATGKGR